MTPYSHNSLNQITALGGSSGVRSVSVRGSTSEAAKVKAKTGAAGSSWKNARMLEGNRFEADLDLSTGANEIDLQARDGPRSRWECLLFGTLSMPIQPPPLHPKRESQMPRPTSTRCLLVGTGTISTSSEAGGRA